MQVLNTIHKLRRQPGAGMKVGSSWREDLLKFLPRNPFRSANRLKNFRLGAQECAQRTIHLCVAI